MEMDRRDADAAIGHAVKELREERGFSQEQLAARANVSRTTVQNIENGRVSKPSSLPHIAAALGTSVAVLRGQHSRWLGSGEEIGEDDLDEILEDMPDDVRQWALDMAADLMQVARGEQPQDPAAVIDLLERRRKRSA